jgi:probable HAF family extracellular repeat protein
MRLAGIVAVFACVALLYGCGGGSSTSSGISRYVITDLGPVSSSGSNSGPLINNNGQITVMNSMAQIVPSTQEAYLYSGGTKTDLKTSTTALAINNSGQVLFGNVEYTGGNLQNLSGQFGTSFNATAFNNNNQFAGNLQVSGTTGNLNSVTHAAIFSGGKVTDLGVLPLFTSTLATAINDSGQVVGNTSGDPTTGTGVSGFVARAFIYSGGALTDLGTLGGDYVLAYAINNAGQVVGASLLGDDPDSDTHAFLYANGQMTDLGVLSGGGFSAAYSINTSGQSVGAASTPGHFNSYAVLFTQGKVVNLNNQIPANSGWVLASATSINDKGLIVGVGTYNGQQHGFLLTPQ